MNATSDGWHVRTNTDEKKKKRGAMPTCEIRMNNCTFVCVFACIRGARSGVGERDDSSGERIQKLIGSAESQSCWYE